MRMPLAKGSRRMSGRRCCGCRKVKSKTAANRAGAGITHSPKHLEYATAAAPQAAGIRQKLRRIIASTPANALALRSILAPPRTLGAMQPSSDYRVRHQSGSAERCAKPMQPRT